MKAWLEVLRISNLPTVWTNLVAGTCVAGAFADVSLEGPIGGWKLAVVLVAGSMLYLGGMVLNDVFDLDIDRRERPERPIPSGRVPATVAATVGWGLVVVGALLPWSISIATGVVAVVVAGLVLLYDRIHAATAWSVVVMAGCRVGLYLMAGAMVMSEVQQDAFRITRPDLEGPLVALLIAIPVFIHVASFSLVARFEVPTSEENCPSCGHPVLGDQSTCPECGEASDVATRHERAEATLGRRRAWGGTGTLALLIPFAACCGLATFVMGIGNSGAEPSEVFRVLGLSFAILVVLGIFLLNTTRDLARRPRAVGRFVVRSIAAMSLYDTALVGMMILRAVDAAPTQVGAAFFAAVACLACFVLVCWAHRRIPGT